MSPWYYVWWALEYVLVSTTVLASIFLEERKENESPVRDLSRFPIPAALFSDTSCTAVYSHDTLSQGAVRTRFRRVRDNA